MKKFLTIAVVIAVAMASLTFQSCDDDQQVAMMLGGTWEGQVSSEYYYNRWGSYGQDYFTVWHFDCEPGARHGSGWEQDYVSGRRYRDYFHWVVMDDGNTIEMTYQSDPRNPHYIYNFYIADRNYFSGEIQDRDGRYTQFRLRYIEDQGYYYDYGWSYYSKPASTIVKQHIDR